MTLELNLTAETVAKINEHAAATGQDVASFVAQAVAEKLADVDLSQTAPSSNGADWEQQLRACIDLHPAVTHIVDDRRASIYAGRGE
jgi:uncharacterized protein (DUF1778 family)